MSITDLHPSYCLFRSSMKDAKESRKDLIKFAFWTCSQLERFVTDHLCPS